MQKIRLRKKVQQLLQKSRECAILAIGIYNNPSTVFRTRAYIVLTNIAWTTLFHAIFERDKVNYYYKDPNDRRRYVRIEGEPKSWDISKCANIYFKGDNRNPVFCNVSFFVSVRNRIEHSYAPEIDPYVFGESQSYLINYEQVLVSEFGNRWALADTLVFSLQYSRVKTEEQVNAMKKAQSKDLLSLRRHIDAFRETIDTNILSDPTYAFKVFLIPKPANKQSTADAAVEFVKYDPDKPEEMKNYQHIVGLIKEKKVPVDSRMENIRLVNNSSEPHDRVLFVNADSGIPNDLSAFSLTRNQAGSDGILLYPKLSEEIFKDATGFVDTALMLNRIVGEFPLSPRSTYYVYAGRESIVSPEAAQLFLWASYNSYIPFFYWLTHISSDNAKTFLTKTLHDPAYPKVLSIFRLLVACENNAWLSYIDELTKSIEHHTQKPQWYWSLYNMRSSQKKVSAIYKATMSTPNQIVFGKKVQELVDNPQIAKEMLTVACSDQAIRGDCDRSDIRLLDLIAYYREISLLLTDPLTGKANDHH